MALTKSETRWWKEQEGSNHSRLTLTHFWG